MYCRIFQSLTILASLATGSSARLLKRSSETVLEARQDPGVIANDLFLRRAHHSSERLHTAHIAHPKLTRERSRHCRRLPLHGWRPFLLHEQWNTSVPLL